MKRRLCVVVWSGVAAALVGFFLPWAMLDIKTTEAEKQIASAAKRGLGKSFQSVRNRPNKQPSWIRSKKAHDPTIPTRISGFQVPRYANRKNVKTVMGLVELVTKKREAIGQKSYAVYLVPGLALLCGLLLAARGGATSPVAFGVALVCGAVAVVGCWTLLTTDTRAKYAMAIGPGLWLSLAAYAVLALSAAAHALPESLRRRVRRRLPSHPPRS